MFDIVDGLAGPEVTLDGALSSPNFDHSIRISTSEGRLWTANTRLSSTGSFPADGEDDLETFAERFQVVGVHTPVDLSLSPTSSQTRQPSFFPTASPSRVLTSSPKDPTTAAPQPNESADITPSNDGLIPTESPKVDETTPGPSGVSEDTPAIAPISSGESDRSPQPTNTAAKSQSTSAPVPNKKSDGEMASSISCQTWSFCVVTLSFVLSYHLAFQ